MSAIVCGKRSSIFEEIPSPSSSSSKRIRCSSSTSPVRFSGPSPFLLVDHLIAIFPSMDKKIIEQALENNGHDLDLAIKCLNDLRLGCADKVPAIADNSLDACPQPNDQPREDPMLSRNLSLDDAEWVELFVREMSAASDVEDARIRASRALEAFEKSIYARAKDETAQNFQQNMLQEHLLLKEQVQALLQENGILKRAVSIQHERQKEFETKSQELQQLKQLLSQCQEHIRTLEVNNYALSMHLKQAQQNNSIPGRFNPDIF
ncbi:uncharacterized protein LOC130815236 isoform X2 [Amaranthus tricolor]|uniref:uncharacterized protein LOC130815236 isoform X2 n=1 Tax=Amaranthus tricolor TaxID=29722 RepID=UPI00258EA3BF|nr:uncharacterized protein LOC130815236 isoform X2 [Amaranthus tricolor]